MRLPRVAAPRSSLLAGSAWSPKDVPSSAAEEKPSHKDAEAEAAKPAHKNSKDEVARAMARAPKPP